MVSLGPSFPSRFWEGCVRPLYIGSKEPKCTVIFDKQEVKVIVVAEEETILFPELFALEFDFPEYFRWQVQPKVPEYFRWRVQPFNHSTARLYLKKDNRGNRFHQMSPYSEFQFKVETDFSKLPKTGLSAITLEGSGWASVFPFSSTNKTEVGPFFKSMWGK